MTTLGIGQLTAIELTPVEYITLAAEANLDTVSLFLNPMANIQGPCLTTRKNYRVVKDCLDATGVKAANIEVFPLLPGVEIEEYRSALEMGRELNARGITVLLYDADETRVTNRLSHLCELTAELGLLVGIEFMPLAPGWRTIQEAADLVTRINQPNLGLCLDILHLIRAGNSIADVADINPKLISYAQLCDSRNTCATLDYVEEATEHRLAPGTGFLPIKQFLQALPPGVPLEIEVPQPSDIPAGVRVKAIVNATRRQIKMAGL